MRRARRWAMWAGMVAACANQTALAAKPTATAALQLAPIQRDVEFDKPADASACTIAAESQGKAVGWIVRDKAGQVLRRFLDTNADNKVDQWCYYKDGIEVYRDVDVNFNGKADEYRWLGTAGTRWGLDRDEDGHVDVWKRISPEEVSIEVVGALRDRDATRFRRLLLTTAELDELGFTKEQAAELKKKTAAAGEGFAEFAKRQRAVSAKSEWLQFGGRHPGLVPSGTDGAKQDIEVYDNVSAVVETGGKHAQLAIGTLVRVGQAWRAIDLPTSLEDAQASQAPAGYFFNAALARTAAVEQQPAGGLNKDEQEMLRELERLEKELDATSSLTAKAKLHGQKADLLQQLFDKATEDSRVTWLRQLAESVTAAVQAGQFPDGVERLKTFAEKLKGQERDKEFVPYVRFRYLASNYNVSVQLPNADFVKIQDQWQKDLEEFVTEFPAAEDRPEAMLQLAIAKEFAGKEDDAIRWFGKIAQETPDTLNGKKAAGAKRRLESVGKPLKLHGKALDGRVVDLGSQRGQVTVIHYWATWCEPCKDDIRELKRLQAKYAAEKVQLIGISLDNSREAMVGYLKTNQLPWPQLFEDGGLDSRLATDLGVFTLPMMLLIDKQGNVINRSVHIGELDGELAKLFRP